MADKKPIFSNAGVLSQFGATDTVALANGGTGASLTDPGADKILFWDDSAGAVGFLTPNANLSITGTDLDASGGGGGITAAQAIVYSIIFG